MENEIVEVEVILRRNKKYGDVEAFMPYEIANYKGHATCYAHRGQHSEYCHQYLLKDTIPVDESEDDAKALLKELKSIGYNVTLRKRRNYDKYLAAYRASKNIS